MSKEPVANESFEQFKNSFSYGSRTDLNFKFLANLSLADASDFFKELLWNLGAAIDSGDYSIIFQHIYDAQLKAYSSPGKWKYDDRPYKLLNKKTSQAKMTLLTSSGHFAKSDDPQPFGCRGMTQDDAIKRIMDFIKAEPVLSAIPNDTPPDQLSVRHGGYDIRAARADANVAFPLEIMRQLEKENLIGRLAANAYSFVGACSQGSLNKKALPKWLEIFSEEKIEAVLLVPV